MAIILVEMYISTGMCFFPKRLTCVPLGNLIPITQLRRYLNHVGTSVDPGIFFSFDAMEYLHYSIKTQMLFVSISISFRIQSSSHLTGLPLSFVT